MLSFTLFLINLISLKDENGKNCILIVPILLEIEKRKILFLAEFNPDGNLIFYDSDEIICGEENISNLINK